VLRRWLEPAKSVDNGVLTVLGWVYDIEDIAIGISDDTFQHLLILVVSAASQRPKNIFGLTRLSNQVQESQSI